MPKRINGVRVFKTQYAARMAANSNQQIYKISNFFIVSTVGTAHHKINQILEPDSE